MDAVDIGMLSEPIGDICVSCLVVVRRIGESKREILIRLCQRDEHGLRDLKCSIRKRYRVLFH